MVGLYYGSPSLSSLSLFPRVHMYKHACTSCIDRWAAAAAAAAAAAITTVLQHLRACDAHMKTHSIACIRVFVARETLCRATSVALAREQPRFFFFLFFFVPLSLSLPFLVLLSLSLSLGLFRATVTANEPWTLVSYRAVAHTVRDVYRYETVHKYYLS